MGGSGSSDGACPRRVRRAGRRHTWRARTVARDPATFRDTGLTVDAEAIGDEVVEVERSDTVDWQGSVTAPPGVYSGTIAVDLPPPFGEAEIDSWDGESDSTANAGVKDYDLTSLVPAGVEFRVVGSHTDENGSCTGYVNLEIEGGPFDSPLAPISLAGTVVDGRRPRQPPCGRCSGVAVMKVGRTIAVAVLGFLFMLFVAVDLVLFGVVPLNSVVVTILPAARTGARNGAGRHGRATPSGGRHGPAPMADA